jgi:hypothetical protein
MPRGPLAPGFVGRESVGRTAVVRQVSLVVVAIFLAIGGNLAPTVARPVAAAVDALNLVASTTYTIQPASHVVRVSLDLTATNNKPNTSSAGIVTRYFSQGARLAIHAEARNVRATVGGTRLAATTTAADGYAILEVTFRDSLFYKQSTRVRVTYDLPGGLPRSKSDIRVGTAFATFVAWAFGDSGSVRIVVPKGFQAATTGSPLARSTSGGATVFTASGIQDVGAWYAVVNADRQAGLTSDRIDLAGGEHVVVRAWPEDKLWRQRVKALLTNGLPELVRIIGLDWPVSTDLQVSEVHTPLLEGYAGVFFENQDKIEVSEDLDDLTIVHEASHAWFNGNLFRGRWLNEGFADTYAALTLAKIGTKGDWAPHPVSPTQSSAVPLEDWVHPGRISDATTNAREQYGYDASWTVIRSLVDEIGVDGMQTVLRATKDRTIAYVGAGEPEKADGPVDWQRFLDLLDETAGSKTADDLFRRWVGNAGDRELLDARAAARTAYGVLIDAGHGWLPPAFVRVPMSSWDFSEAKRRIPVAAAVLGVRDQIAAVVAPIGVDPPADLRAAYEGSTDTMVAAQALADQELRAARALVAAETAAAAPRDMMANIGLMGETPDAALAAARTAFQTGAPDAAARAELVAAQVGNASALGRTRLIGGIGTVVIVLVLLVVAAFVIPRPRATPRILQAHPVAFEATDQAVSYATLPDQSTDAARAAARAPDDASSDPPTDQPKEYDST